MVAVVTMMQASSAKGRDWSAEASSVCASLKMIPALSPASLLDANEEAPQMDDTSS